MELPTRTSPGNYIAILKVCHVFMYSLLHCLSGFCSPLGKSRLLSHSWGGGDTLQRHWEWWVAKQIQQRLDSALSWWLETPPLQMPLGDLHHPEALQSG